MEVDPTRRLDLLLSAPAHELLNILSAQSSLSILSELRLSKALRKQHPPDLVAAVLGLLELRQRGRAKFARADQMYFTRAALEQATPETVAHHHAQRFSGHADVVDMCCGVGGDLIALGGRGPVRGIDVDRVHARMAQLNARAYGLTVDVCTADVRDAPLDGIAAAFVDPSRRTETRRLRPGASEPPLDWCFGLASAVPAVGIKAAPGLPLELVPDGWEIEFVADQRELKEAVLWSPGLRTAARRATVLPSGDALVSNAGPAVEVAQPGAFLLDPSPAVTRAGLVEELARTIGAWKIDAHVAFLSSDNAVSTPFGRWLHIEASLPWNLKHLRAELRALDIGTVDIRKRGSAVDVEGVQRRLKLTGARAATVVLSRVRNRPWAFVCTT
ncbi:MAG TPA: class I SAM-dependent methyltransferase [Chloroflexota bacterium]